MSKQPIILMSFAANDLSGVSTETQKIWESVSQQTSLVPQKLENTSIEDLADAVIDAGKDLFMFHFGGHADEGNIVLDGFKDIDKTRLSRLLLPRNHNIQIVFLNGCLSYGQVDIFTAKGVKAVIATNAKVNDTEAVRISKYFYKLFFEKEYSLKEAFETAEATVVGDNSFLTIVNPGETSKLHSAWTLFVHAHHKEIMDWTLKDFLSNSTADPSAGIVDEIKGDVKKTNTAFKTTVRDLVASGKLEKALSTLETHLPDEINEIAQLKGRFSSLNRKSRMGLLSSGEESVERNKITASILELI